ncbi:MAG TPA: Rieske (2Fe-2S) protein [Candidatus Dormibacteraeota bacterium]|nr:Rieske (2Fe-2S) protein [Candidatus Dormibacteraeota bacterium]
MSRRSRARRFVDALLRDRRPPRFEAGAEDARLLEVATSLRGARTANDLPSADFVSGLEDRLRRQLEAGPEPRREPSRRGFLIGGGIAAVAAAGVAVDLGVRHADQDRTQGELVPAAGAWQPVATLADLADGHPRRFRAGAVEGVLVPHPDGSVHALSAVCTHMGCLLEARAKSLLCPCHGASFDLQGAPVDREYLTTPLPRLRSRVAGDRVEVLVV